MISIIPIMLLWNEIGLSNKIFSKYDFKLREKKLNYVLERKYVSVFTLAEIRKEYATLDHSLYGIEDDWMIITDIE